MSHRGEHRTTLSIIPCFLNLSFASVVSCAKYSLQIQAAKEPSEGTNTLFLSILRLLRQNDSAYLGIPSSLLFWFFLSSSGNWGLLRSVTISALFRWLLFVCCSMHFCKIVNSAAELFYRIEFVECQSPPSAWPELFRAGLRKCFALMKISWIWHFFSTNYLLTARLKVFKGEILSVKFYQETKFSHSESKGWPRACTLSLGGFLASTTKVLLWSTQMTTVPQTKI